MSRNGPQAEPPHVTPAVRAAIALAERNGWPHHLEPTSGFAVRLETPAGSRFVIGSDLGLNVASAARVATDKTFAAHFLAHAGIPVVPTHVVRDPEAPLPAGLQPPVAIKPNGGRGGLGLTRLTSHDGLSAAFARAREHDRLVVAQPWIDARELRIIVADRQLIAAYERTPATTTGADGKPVRADAANLAQGATATDRTESIDAALVDLAARAADVLGLTIAGVDLLLDEKEQPHLLEINAAPGLHFLSDHPRCLNRLMAIVERRYAGG